MMCGKHEDSGIVFYGLASRVVTLFWKNRDVRRFIIDDEYVRALAVVVGSVRHDGECVFLTVFINTQIWRRERPVGWRIIQFADDALCSRVR